MNKRDISDFYEKDVPAYASYDNLRKLSGVDGLKISQRKILWSAFKRCYSEYVKTDTMCAQTQIDTAYIHGAANLEGVIDTMAASYVGSNNYPLLTGNSGGFGCRISPRPSAGRYTRVRLSEIAKKVFDQSDSEILDRQFFEGQWIEPKFLVPVFPLLFLNGSDGISTAFSGSICPRDPAEVIEYIRKKLNGTERPRLKLLPWFRGHAGKVEFNAETGRNESFGAVTKNSMTWYTVTELPIGVDYQKYVETLDKMSDSGIIQNYTDKCESTTDRIQFEIRTTREFTRNHEDERSLYEAFKLVKSLPETLCCIDENNRVREYKDVQEILDSFIEIRLRYYDKRKKHVLETMKAEIEKLVSKFLFCDGIIKKTIKVADVKKADIVKQLEKIAKIVKADGSYDYLLRIPISQVTKEEIESLKTKIKGMNEEFKRIKATTIQDMWLSDLDAFKKALKEIG